MNRIVLAPTVLALTFFTTCANANIDQLKDLLGGKKAESTVTSSSLTEMATSAASNIDLASLVSSVAGNLNVSENQSEGLEDVPSLSGNSAASSSSSLSGLLNKASEYSSTLKSVNDLKQQFEALGLSTDMIASFVTQISSYLNVNADEETQALFKSGLDNLLTAL